MVEVLKHSENYHTISIRFVARQRRMSILLQKLEELVKVVQTAKRVGNSRRVAGGLQSRVSADLESITKWGKCATFIPHG